MLELVSLMALALVLGFKHSYDSDHLIAVSNILRKVDSVKSSIRIGFSWAIGHMLTATIVTTALFIFKESFLNNVLPHLGKIAGLMLVALGILSLWDFFRLHSHMHSHDGIIHSHPHIHLKKYKDKKHSHIHMFGIGIVQGLASNDELLILFAASLAITSIGGLIAALGLFSLGVVLGMVLFAIAFSYPLIKLHSAKIYKYVSFGTGSAGIAYGTLMLFALA
ncbi:sulfite exporter TauE/SafE family protein [Candidatus Woesearchaeota archaeon]|nr:sulfite exporter TauE/SafE family protein [Candidatus Woesearchaeota archaeon]